MMQPYLPSAQVSIFVTRVTKSKAETMNGRSKVVTKDVLVVVDRNTARLSNDGKQRLRKQVSVVLRKKGSAVASA